MILKVHSRLTRNMSSFSKVRSFLLLDQVYSLPVRSSSTRLFRSMIAVKRKLHLLTPPACFSHLLFLGDMLAIVTNRAKQECEISRLVPQLVDGDQSILQYADDTILLMEHNFEKAVNMKLPYVLLSSYQGPKLISTKMRFTALVKKNQQQYITLWLPKGEYPFR